MACIAICMAATDNDKVTPLKYEEIFMCLKFVCNTLKLLLVPILLLSSSVNAAPFSAGSKSLSIVIGSGSAFNDNYTIFGAGVGYYVVDGLEISIDVEVWTGGDRSINKVSPGVQYVFARNEQLKPYIGVFFKRAAIEGFEDLDSVGGRIGAVFSNRSNYYLSAGLVYENDLDCTETLFVQCDDTYPELSLTFLL